MYGVFTVVIIVFELLAGHLQVPYCTIKLFFERDERGTFI